MQDRPKRKISRRTLIVGASSAVGAAAGISIWQSIGDRSSAALAAPDSALWISTTQASPWQIRSLRPPGFYWDTVNLDVFTEDRFQTIEGFGCCFNELGWTSLQALSPNDRENIFRELFTPSTGTAGAGANFNICRMPVGANDFSRGWYSYDEIPGDFALEHFTIANDLETLVPFIKSALRCRPSLRLWASPWSPPSWMKRNGYYAEALPQPGFPPNGIKPEQVGAEGSDMFIPEDRYYTAYANYFGRFIDAYKQQGIDIGMVMPQNEFNSAQAFPSCTWTPYGLARFIQSLGPVMSERGVAVFFGTLERAHPNLLDVVLSDQKAGRYITGAGLQWAGKGALSSIHKAHPDLVIYQSEQECGDGKNNWHYCVYCWHLMKFYLEGGANAYMYWNLSLPRDGESHWGWRQNSLITVDLSARTYQFNHEYYLLKHISHFVQPGAKRLRTQGLLVEALAFLNPDKSVVVVFRNSVDFGRPIDITVAHRRVAGWMEPDSFNTLLLRPER